MVPKLFLIMDIKKTIVADYSFSNQNKPATNRLVTETDHIKTRTNQVKATTNPSQTAINIGKQHKLGST